MIEFLRPCRELLAALAEGKASIWEFERYGSFDPMIAAKPLLVTPTKEFPFVDEVYALPAAGARSFYRWCTLCSPSMHASVLPPN